MLCNRLLELFEPYIIYTYCSNDVARYSFKKARNSKTDKQTTNPRNHASPGIKHRIHYLSHCGHSGQLSSLINDKIRAIDYADAAGQINGLRLTGFTSRRKLGLHDFGAAHTAPAAAYSFTQLSSPQQQRVAIISVSRALTCLG